MRVTLEIIWWESPTENHEEETFNFDVYFLTLKHNKTSLFIFSDHLSPIPAILRALLSRHEDKWEENISQG